MNVIALFINEWDKFLLLLARFAGISFIPVFNTKSVPVQWRVFCTLIITFFAWDMGLAGNVTIKTDNILVYFWVVITEALTGIALALVIQFFFAGVQLAGQAIDTQMGLSMMNVVDPISGTQAPIIGNFKYVVALLVFLEVNGHHYFISAIFESYEALPIGQNFLLSPYFIQKYINYFGNIFIVGCKLSMPIVGTLMVTDFAMGVIARTVPQMNIFVVGMPVKILVGLFVLLVTIPLYVYLLNSYLADVINEIYDLIRVVH
ncbi:MAG: flagellar biosynthetic protein FliR [Clostridia bacterium]|nr:flagellar biosynthetic protein FliR [Clostridia bacterium]MDD4047612.1 flagellar biosynthetic protein FliR [Clostridia bacterium]